MPGSVLSARDTAVNKMDADLCPLGTYILVERGWGSGTDRLNK